MNNTKCIPARCLTVLAILLALYMALSTQALAAGGINTESDASLTLIYEKNAVVLKNVNVRIFRAATVSVDGTYTLCGAFAEKPVAVNYLTSSGWSSAALTLAGYATADKISPLLQATSGADGKVTTGELDTGLYLVVADSLTQGGTVYSSAPFLISVPTRNSSDLWVYDVVSYPKCTKVTPPDPPGDDDDDDEPDSWNYKVVKQWVDEEYENIRPAGVTIDIYRNESLYRTQLLNEGNKWSYSWSSSSSAKWEVIERPSSGARDYQVSVTQTGNVFYVVNTYIESSVPQPYNPPDPSQPPVEPLTPTPAPTSGVKLPQTGQLWWPVPLCAGGGLLLIGVGLLLSQSKDLDVSQMRGKKKR